MYAASYRISPRFDRVDKNTYNVTETMHADYNDTPIIPADRDTFELKFLNKKIEKLHNYSTLKVETGTTNEALIEILIDRLTLLNAEVRDKYNGIAILKLNAALDALNTRRNVRKSLGIYGSKQNYVDDEGYNTSEQQA